MSNSALAMENGKQWIAEAHKFMRASLSPSPHELNEIDWKSSLSEDRERVAAHLSAFANHPGGGFFAFGISPEGKICGTKESDVQEIVKKLGNLAREGVEPPQKIDFQAVVESETTILFVHVLESLQKPVHLRGKGIEASYLRSGGQTRKMSRQEIANTVLNSRQLRYEELEAVHCSAEDIFDLLDCDKLFDLVGTPMPQDRNLVLEQLINQKMVYRNGNDYSVTNLGAIVAAKNLKQLPGKERFPIRIIKYNGASKIVTDSEKEFSAGYAICFQELIRYILSLLPTSEIIKDALRKNVPVYPEITVRELVANALIHRDFSITSTNPMIEIFSDRIEITNPGTLLPSVKIERIIDTALESRNEVLAAFMRRAGICEERGSGIDKALFAVEFYGLPPIDFVEGPHFFKAVLYSPRSFKQMSLDERLRACYQHCCLKYVSNERMTNASFRKRLGLKEGQYPLAWKVITTAIEKGLIRSGNPKGRSRKFAHYVPYWS